MQAIIINNYLSPYGELIIGVYDGRLCLCDWLHRQKREAIDHRIKEGLKAEYKTGTSPLIELVVTQLNEYFQKKRESFDLPLLMVGTDFQKNVWNALMEIPYGKSETYQQLSLRMKNPKAIRAVASANGANALSIVIPCHRVIGSGNQLVGYAGGLDAKKGLLELESDSAAQLDLF